MIINNKKKVTSLKRLFFLVSVIIALITLVLFLLDFTIYGIAMVGVFTLWFLYFQVSDYQYIEFSNENNKILLRYYKAVKFGKVEFNSIMALEASRILCLSGVDEEKEVDPDE